MVAVVETTRSTAPGVINTDTGTRVLYNAMAVLPLG